MPAKTTFPPKMAPFLGVLLFVFLIMVLISSAAPKYFEFHDNFWMNLHHTLFREAVTAKMSTEARAKLGVSPPLSDSDLSPEEKQAWTDATRLYADTFAGRRLLFDDQLVSINDLLSHERDVGKFSPEGLPGAVAQCLEKAAPVYRAHWWPAHQKANEQFIAGMEPRVEELGPAVIPQLEHFFGMSWQAQPLLVDVTYYVAEVGGAYTTEHPAHTTVASGREDNYGLRGLETLFHEGAHTLTDKMASALGEECERQKKGCAADLWHAAQFYIVGEVWKRRLAERGTAGYVPYAYKFVCTKEGTGLGIARPSNAICNPMLMARQPWIK